MDFHKIDDVTIDKVKAAHREDLRVQDELGVKYHKFWVNEDSGHVFCLMEGPDRESCETVHLRAHGNKACAMTQVDAGFFDVLMGENHAVDEGLVRASDGQVDLGYRNILLVSLRGIQDENFAFDLTQLLEPGWARRLTLDNFKIHNGRRLSWHYNNSLAAVFDSVDDAVNCAADIRRSIVLAEKNYPAVIYKIAVSSGQPVNEEGEFFRDTLRLAHLLTHTAGDNQSVFSSMTLMLSDQDEQIRTSNIKSPTPSDETFLLQLFSVTDLKLSDPDFTLTDLCKEIGISRPQLYRRIRTITDRSPVDFLREIRLEKAFTLLTQKAGNVMQIAAEVGYSNPSYFSRCFFTRYGFKPSLF